jgi:putative hydrolase of the HAD superfamily
MENLVFDLGGVLLTWDPELLARRVFQARNYNSERVLAITKHPAWKSLDRGEISLDQAFARFTTNDSDDNSVLEIKEFLYNMPHFIYQLVEGIKILKWAQQAGYRTFVLSNYNREYFNVVKQRFDWFEGFDGMIMSFDVGFVKPEKEIYQSLLDRFELDPRKTVFIDDKLENVKAAENFGITGVVCDHHTNVVQALQSLGVLNFSVQNSFRFSSEITSFKTEEYTRKKGPFLPDEMYGICLDTLVKACVDLVLIHAESDDVFIAKRNYHPQKDWWVACGGRMTPGETPQQTLAKLVKRELSVDLSTDFESCGIVSIDFINCYSHIWGKRRQDPENNGTADIVLAYSVVASQTLFDRLVMDPEEYSESKFVSMSDLESGKLGLHPALSRLAADVRQLRRFKRLVIATKRPQSLENDKFVAKLTRIYSQKFIELNQKINFSA